MERFRRKKSHARVSSPVSEDWEFSNYNGKPDRLTKSASDSYSCSIIATLEDNQLSFDLGNSSSGELPTGVPMKKLLADEMSKETESGRRSPSIIARLMGLDGLPTPHNTNKKQKRHSDTHQRGSASAGFPKDSRSHRRNAMGQQQFKDVYEVVDRSNLETRSNTSHAASNRNSSEDEIGFIRQKFMDAKRFSTDEKLQHSKEFHEALEVLDSNKHLLLKFLQEPDSLFSKHLRDLHDSPASRNGCMDGIKSNNALKCNIDVIGCQSGGEASQKIDISHSHKRATSCYCNMYNTHSTDMVKLNFSEGDEDSSVPTKIVVLKPNIGKSLRVTKSVSSTSQYEPPSNIELYNECSNLKHRGPELRGKGSKQDDLDIYGRKSRESRELAREITRRMRNNLGVDSFNVSSPGYNGYRGYSADESSHDISENDSSSESEVTNVSSRTTLRNKASSLRYMESSVNMEAKKRLSERWKMTHTSQELGASSKGSTLADMLAIPDVDIRPRSPNILVPRAECFRTSGRNDRTAKITAPLGISSRDGWKDGCLQNLSRSRSLPASANHLGSPKSNTKRESNQAITAERFLVRKESTNHARNKSSRRDFRRKDVSFSESRKLNDEKFEAFDVRVEMVDDIHEVQSSGNIMKNTIEGKDSPEVKAVILEMPSGRHDTCLARDSLVEQENNNVYDEPATASEIPSCILPEDGSSTSDMPSLPQVGSSSFLQCAATHAESPASSKESEQPSPVSVLEAPFVEDLSSGSECFERVSAELHGLRKQLQLLKLESEVYDEGSVVVSSDEYGEDSTELHEREHFSIVGEYWESWYLVDVLNHSGLDKTDCEMFLGTWHSPDCPIGLWVFEDLEKRYGELESCSRSERRLLFDSINAQIVEISQQFVDMEPWVKTPRKYTAPQWLKDVLKTELHKLLEKHKTKIADNGLDMAILGDMQWMKLGEHISAVGRDIEALLIDELIAESLIV